MSSLDPPSDAHPPPLEAGRTALARGAWVAARACFEAALAGGETPEALEGLGWALWWLDDTAGSLDRREQAFRLYRQRGNPRSAARVATGLASDYYDVRGEAVASGWLERARRLLEGLSPGREHGWLSLWEGHFALLGRGDVEAARGHGRAAREQGHAQGLVDLEMLGVALEGLVLVAEGQVAEGMRRLDEATAAVVAGEVTDLDAASAACCLLVHACERVRDYERAAQWAETVEGFGRRWDIAPALAICRTQYAAMLIGRGEWGRAEAELVRTRERLARSRPRLVVEAFEQLAELRRRQGALDEAEELFARAEGRSLPLLGRGAIALDRGDPARAVDLLERFLRRTPADNWTGRAAALELLVRGRLALDERPVAEAALAALRELSAAVGTPPIRAAADLAEGTWAAAEGAPDVARRRFEDAVDLFRRGGSPFEEARARLDLAGALRALGREEGSRDEVRLALDACRRLGARGEAERAGRLLEDSAGEAPGGPGARGAAGLTPRELEVLRLVAQGLGDKEIASRLTLSEHTVHRHLSNVRTKLGLPSRAAAVAFAARRRLL